MKPGDGIGLLEQSGQELESKAIRVNTRRAVHRARVQNVLWNLGQSQSSAFFETAFHGTFFFCSFTKGGGGGRDREARQLSVRRKKIVNNRLTPSVPKLTALLIARPGQGVAAADERESNLCARRCAARKGRHLPAQGRSS